MHEWLEPFFGENGAVVVLYLTLFILILVVMWLVYWLIRQYGGAAIGGGKGRVPRLGIIDSLSIDQRHRLVLIRRDNVEHLILIGKTSDLVVEPSIVRGVPASGRPRPGQAPRQQAQRKDAPDQQQAPAGKGQQAGSAAPPVRSDTAGISEPIPFPQRPPARLAPRPTNAAPPPTESPEAIPQPAQARVAPRRSPSPPAPVPVTAAVGAAAASASGHFEEPARPTRIESAVMLTEPVDSAARERPAQPARLPATPRGTPAAESRREEVAVEVPYSPAADGAAGSPQQGEAAAKSAAETPTKPGGDKDSATKVSDLEQEMARLLGEITSKRDS